MLVRMIALIGSHDCKDSFTTWRHAPWFTNGTFFTMNTLTYTHQSKFFWMHALFQTLWLHLGPTHHPEFAGHSMATRPPSAQIFFINLLAWANIFLACFLLFSNFCWKPHPCLCAFMCCHGVKSVHGRLTQASADLRSSAWVINWEICPSSCKLITLRDI